ncbi:hypothetical protein ACN08Y_10135 [Rothia sp. P5764]|uniref:hypothetical protein n=1 Tax=Rothia sp. P5764 TaxID=3402654 RepID=UPI003AD67D43
MTIVTSSWTHPTTGQIRHYINFQEWAPAAGITKENGEYIFPAAQFVPSKRVSGSSLQKLKGFKIWADKNGKITVDNFINFYNWGVDDSAEFAQKLETYFTENGGFDFMGKAEEIQEDAKEVVEGEESPAFNGELTEEETAYIEEKASEGKPGERFETPVDLASEAAEEIAEKHGVSSHVIYNAYLKAKGKRTWEMPTPTWKNFKRQFEA